MFDKIKINKHEWEVVKKFVENYSDKINDLKLEMEKLKTHMNSLRGFINRKIEKTLDDGGTEPTEQNNKNPVLVPI